jgi:tetratricopeptide (TPR) repeat protein
MRLASGRARFLLVAGTIVLGYVGYQGGLCLWVASHHRAARQALARRDFRTASIHLDKALAGWPDDALMRLQAAQAARRRGDLEKASSHLRIYERRHGIADALVLEHRLLQVQAGDLRELTALLERASDTSDASEALLILEAVIEGSVQFAQNGSTQPDEAEALVARTLPLADDWLRRQIGTADQAQGLVWRGRLHGLKKDYPKAVADLRRAVALDSDSFQARWHLAQTIVQQAPEEALAQLRTLRRLDPDNMQVFFLVAVVLHRLGQLDEARRMLDEMLLAHPNDLPALVERGSVALDSRQLSDAEALLRRAEAIAPDFPEVCLVLSRVLLAAGRSAEATQYRERFLYLEAERKRAHDAHRRLPSFAG